MVMARPGSGEFHSVVGGGDVRDDGVTEFLGAGVVEADVVGGPAGAELVALGGKLADQLYEIAVVGFASCCCAENRDDVAGGAVPVDVELAGARVEEDVAGAVDWAGSAAEHVGEEGLCKLVGGEVVQPGVVDECGGAGSARRGCGGCL